MANDTGSTKVRVYGVLGQRVPADLEDAVRWAQVVVAPRRLESRVRIQPTQARFVAYEDLSSARTATTDEFSTRLSQAIEGTERVLVVASGDPGFFGILRTILRMQTRDGLVVDKVVPEVSSVAAVFAALGMPWDDAVVVSAHGRDPRLAVNVCRRFPKVAVLCSPAFGPSALAEALRGWPRRLAVLCDAGGDSESLIECSLDEAVSRTWDHPCIAVVYRTRETGATRQDPSAGGSEVKSVAGAYVEHCVDGTSGPLWVAGAGPVGRWGAADPRYLRNGTGPITKRFVRAAVLAALQPRLGCLLWDVGAGFGSVSVEAAALGAAVVAIERDRHRVGAIEANAKDSGVEVRVVVGEAPGCLEGLPDPDAVFVGGGGSELEAIIRAVCVRRPGVIALTTLDHQRAAMAEHVLEDAGFSIETSLLQASTTADVSRRSRRLLPQSPVFLVEARADRSATSEPELDRERCRGGLGRSHSTRGNS